MTTENSGAIAPGDDEAMFDALASGQDIPETEEPALVETETEEAPQAQEPETSQEVNQPETEQDDPKLAKVRDGLLRELKEAREAAREQREMNARLIAQFEAMRPQIQKTVEAPQKPKEFFDYEDPFQAIEHKIVEQVSPVLQQFREMQVYNARLTAQNTLGNDAVKEAEEAFNNAARTGQIDPVEHARINNSPNPFAAAVEWHNRNKVLQTVGTDLGAWETKFKERLKSDPAFMAEMMEAARAKAMSSAPVVNAKPQTSLPSVSRMGAAAPIGRADSNDLDDEALFDALASKKN